MDAAKQLADDLEEVLTGRVAVRDIVVRRAEYSAVPEGVFANLEHYDADADIRARDASYRKMQDCEMEKLIQLLRCGSPAICLSRITFLEEST